MQTFHPADGKVIAMFTCGPSVYQRAHIGNFRTFLFEDILARYLEYSGYKIKRGMNLTDIEDKSIAEAERRKKTLKSLTEKNIKDFLGEMEFLKMKRPDYLPRASDYIDEEVALIMRLLGRGVAYWHQGNVYFEPLKFPGFGKLYGLDMSKWPSKKRRFHKDTYPGTQWNLGDFILWHGYRPGDKYYWDTKIGRGRPAWNIQDPAMIGSFYPRTLSIYCGGIDNLYRHHDYTLAILESVRSYPMARFWLHCRHLYVNGLKMSKSKGNILYAEDLRRKGYNAAEIRFFLSYSHYREKLSYSDKVMSRASERLVSFRRIVRNINDIAATGVGPQGKIAKELRKIFVRHMEDDLHLKDAFDGLYEILSGVRVDELKSDEASGIIQTLKEIDKVFMFIF